MPELAKPTCLLLGVAIVAAAVGCGRAPQISRPNQPLIDALRIEQAMLAGFDWGGRAACIVAALFPERCAGLVTVNGYNVHDLAASQEPSSPENEYRYWYQWYFHGERGRAGLTQNRRALCRYGVTGSMPVRVCARRAVARCARDRHAGRGWSDSPTTSAR